MCGVVNGEHEIQCAWMDYCAYVVWVMRASWSRDRPRGAACYAQFPVDGVELIRLRTDVVGRLEDSDDELNS